MDCWERPNVTAYMEITGYFIDSKFRLTPLLSGLTEIEGDHSCTSLENTFLNLLHQYDFEDPMTCIKNSNSPRNTHMAHEIENQMANFSEDNHFIGCMAHEVLKALANGSISTPEKENELATPMAISNLVDPPDEFNLRYDSIILGVALLESYL
ncbi:hypothetical protein O181_063401 [Austropuccinia psidii MF-1]|uniref:Uncharacterized protein n=1 Tax=Austropuccinia psidii MF-1 TaxID=1389203 RepID=A0A9Q3ERQ1_9BASI|nr:hypothetical protein [Austropuccinia psidii MF-1]